MVPMRLSLIAALSLCETLILLALKPNSPPAHPTTQPPNHPTRTRARVSPRLIRRPARRARAQYGGHAFQLIAHQRDERRNDEAEAGQQQRGQLVAQRFAAAGRQNEQRVARGEHATHGELLAGHETGETKLGAQNGEQLAAVIRVISMSVITISSGISGNSSSCIIGRVGGTDKRIVAADCG